MGYFIVLLAILFPWEYGAFEAKGDYAKIQADANRDSLKELFHKRNLLFRGLVILLMGAVFTAGVVGLLGWAWWFGLAYFTYCASVFGYTFTRKLNTLRGLDIWYVSRDKRASKTDRFMVKQAAKYGVALEVFSGRLHKAFLIFGCLVLGGVIVVNLLINN